MKTLRLGFTVHGAISAEGDADVYSFRGTAGTEIWLDIDRTSSTLDSMVELITSDGNTVLAASDNSIAESLAGATLVGGGISRPMEQSLYTARNVSGTASDLYTLNELDAGMRLTLPGNLGTEREYFVRVTGKDGSVGLYEMQIRLKQGDEFAGSTVRHADIRYAQTGIQTRGLPFHSPLIGEGGSTGGTINLGNLAENDRGTISIAGQLAGPGAVNVYAFSLSRADIQSGGNATSISATFDIDFADALARPNTALALYRVAGGNRTLIGYAGDSNIVADQSSPLEGADLTDLSRGSVGSQDAFLGTVELTAGNYEVAVINNSQLPADFDNQFNGAAANNDIRREPINSVVRISEDRFDGNARPV